MSLVYQQFNKMSKYVPREDLQAQVSKPVNQLYLPNKYSSVVGSKALNKNFGLGSPEIVGSKQASFMFTSNAGSIQSQMLDSEPFSPQEQMVRNNSNFSKGISIVELDSVDGLNRSVNPFNIMLLNRLKRQIRSLKQFKQDLLTYIQQQNRSFASLQIKLSAQLSGVLLYQSQKDQQSHHAQSSLIQANIVSVELKLKEKVQQNEQLLKQIQLLKSARSDNFTDDKLGCQSCRLLEVKLVSLKDQAHILGRQLGMAQAESQKLNEVIFDLEQQVIGIDLEVEKRLKQALQNMPEIQNMNKSVPSVEIVQSLKKDLDRAESRCKHYQSLCRSEQQLSSREQDLNHALAEYEMKNISLLQAIGRNEEVSNMNYEKEHKLLLAQQQFNSKIEALRNKQAELSSWQASLSHQLEGNRPVATKKTGFFKPGMVAYEPEQIALKNVSADIHTLSQTQEYYPGEDYRVSLPTRNKEPSQHNNIIIQRPTNLENQSAKNYYSKASNKFQNSRFSNTVDYNHKRRTTEGNNLGRSNLVLNFAPSPSSKVVGSRVRQNGFRSNSKNKHEFGRASNALRERSSSPTRSFKSGHLSPLGRSKVTQKGTYKDAQNKLHKLREELKREIETLH